MKKSEGYIGGCQDYDEEIPEGDEQFCYFWLWVIGLIAGLVIVVTIVVYLGWPREARAEEVAGYDVDRLANAIYLAEGGAATRHPYGILAKYKHTTPRQACINTIRHKYHDWIRQGSKGDYLAYLQSKYAPINSDTDNGTNRFWLNNVRRLYQTRS